MTNRSGLNLELNPRGIEAMLKGQNGFRTRDPLIEHGRRIAATADAGMQAADPDYEGGGMQVDTDDEGRTRARVTVWTATIEARVAEARDRVLTRALLGG